MGEGDVIIKAAMGMIAFMIAAFFVVLVMSGCAPSISPWQTTVTVAN